MNEYFSCKKTQESARINQVLYFINFINTYPNHVTRILNRLICQKEMPRINTRIAPEMCQTLDTVDGQNPAPPRMMIIPLFIGF